MSKTLWNTINIEIPKEMVEITKTGKVSVKNTLTKTKNISKSQKVPSIKFTTSDDNKARIVNNGKEWNLEQLQGQVKKANELAKKNKGRTFKKEEPLKNNKFIKKIKNIVRDNENIKKYINEEYKNRIEEIEDENFEKEKSLSYAQKEEIRRRRVGNSIRDNVLIIKNYDKDALGLAIMNIMSRLNFGSPAIIKGSKKIFLNRDNYKQATFKNWEELIINNKLPLKNINNEYTKELNHFIDFYIRDLKQFPNDEFINKRLKYYKQKLSLT